MHLEAVITDRLAFIAVLFCLDQAIAARDLAGGRAAHSVDLPPQSGGPEGREGLRVIHLFLRDLHPQALLQGFCLLPLGGNRGSLLVGIRSELLGCFPERKADGFPAEAEGHLQPLCWMPRLLFKPRTQLRERNGIQMLGASQEWEAGNCPWSHPVQSA